MLFNAVRSIDADRLRVADLSACETPDNVDQHRINKGVILNLITLILIQN